MKIILDLDMEKCISCGACAVACMDQNDIDVEHGQAPFRTVFTLEEPKDGSVKMTNLSVACMHCDDAPCIKGCPAGCLRKDPDTNLTVYDNTNCIGCHSCAMACPFGAPSFNKDGKIQKCDGCAVRVAHGMKPACVKVCPFDALRVYTEEEYQQVHHDRSLKRLSKVILDQPD